MASVTEAPNVTAGTRNDAVRKYPPLLAIFVAMAIMLAVLPSALNLPQSNPTQTLEYAPVPPDDESPNQSTDGNMGSLGLGSSSAIDGGGLKGNRGPGGELLDPPDPAEFPMDGEFRCAGENPPRQTEDPLAPPCVPFFDGKNFGATYQGVTANEIKLLIYLDGGINYINSSDPTPERRVSPRNRFYDLFETYDPSDPEHPPHFIVDALRTWQAYFNLRFQRYHRKVHFYVYFTDNQEGVTSDERRADVANLLSKEKFFAVLSDATEGFEDEFLRGMARKGVLNFGSFGVRPNSFFQQFPRMIWSYLPSVEQQTESFVNFICNRVAYPGAVARNAGGDLQNKPRTFGLIHTTDPKQNGLRLAAGIVRDRLKKDCNVEFVDDVAMPQCCLAQDGGEVPTYAQEGMADFERAGITTIIWPGGINGNFGKIASANGYQPEWVVMGDRLLDAYYPIVLSSNTEAFDRRAIVVSPQTLHPAEEQQRCWQAYREIDPAMPEPDLRYVCHFYYNLFQFFTGVQVAGPRLTPTTMDEGFRAIPQRPAGEPRVPACFYLPGDYTCIKDGHAAAWSASDRPPGANQVGCWRVIEAGKRYLPKDWAQRHGQDMWEGTYQPTDPCNGYHQSARFNIR